MATLWIWSRRWWRGAKTICICIRICICISVCGVVTWSGKGSQVPKQSSCLWLASQRITGTIRQRLVSSNQALPTELANNNVRSILSTSIYLQSYSSTLIPSSQCQRFLPNYHTLLNIRVYEKQTNFPCKSWTFFLGMSRTLYFSYKFVSTCIFVNLSLRANFECDLQFVFAFVPVFVFGRARQSWYRADWLPQELANPVVEVREAICIQRVTDILYIKWLAACCTNTQIEKYKYKYN